MTEPPRRSSDPGALESLLAGFERIDLAEPEGDAPGSPLYHADPDRLLRVLAANQFEDPYLAFRELYANALDGVGKAADGKISIEVSSRSIVLEDNGSGLDEDGLVALTTLGASTRRGQSGIGRFGIGFAAIFDPALGAERVEFLAARASSGEGVHLTFTPDVGGGVSITQRATLPPTCGGSRVEVYVDPARASKDRVSRVIEVFETHAAYSGVATTLNGRALGRELQDFIRDEIRSGEASGRERALMAATAVRGPVGVAAIDPSRTDSEFRAYQNGLFVCSVELKRLVGRPWPRGVFGAVHAEGLGLVASRNAFVENEGLDRFQEELQQLAFEAAYRMVRYFESTRDAYARIVLLDSLRRGLKTATPESLVSASDDLFSSAVVRAPLFRAWGTGRCYSFEELVHLKETERFSALAYRPLAREDRETPTIRADEAIERDIFRKFSGMRDMPAVARAENVAAPTFWSRMADRLLSGPRAEYSLFRHRVEPRLVNDRTRAVVRSLEAFLATDAVSSALFRLLPGAVPRLGYGASRNAFGPVAAYRQGEIRFNVRHRAIRALAKADDPELASRVLLPVLAHELAHVCHELHDVDFYRTSRALLRALATAASEVDAKRLSRLSGV